ncbi:MAG: hypothetical protein COA66_05445 [Arcobacter sp.]|nr:MAG: hypothetical protein COA66_05445 [Arcobacter sp.]
MSLIKIIAISLFSLVFIIGCANKKENIILMNAKTKSEKTIEEKKVNENCKKYLSSMKHASYYIKNEFNQAYFKKNDFLGAKAQLFLVKNNSSGIFAKNINKANTSYKKYFTMAVKNKCDIASFRIFPLIVIENKITLAK